MVNFWNNANTRGNPGSSDQSVAVDMIFFSALTSAAGHNTQDAKQMTMTGVASTGVGDHQFLRLMTPLLERLNYTHLQMIVS